MRRALYRSLSLSAGRVEEERSPRLRLARAARLPGALLNLTSIHHTPSHFITHTSMSSHCLPSIPPYSVHPLFQTFILSILHSKHTRNKKKQIRFIWLRPLNNDKVTTQKWKMGCNGKKACKVTQPFPSLLAHAVCRPKWKQAWISESAWPNQSTAPDSTHFLRWAQNINSFLGTNSEPSPLDPLGTDTNMAWSYNHQTWTETLLHTTCNATSQD